MCAGSSGWVLILFTNVFIEMNNEPRSGVINRNELATASLMEPARLIVSCPLKQSKPLKIPSLLKQKAEPTNLDLLVTE
jgi:hypothetical protein